MHKKVVTFSSCLPDIISAGSIYFTMNKGLLISTMNRTCIKYFFIPFCCLFYCVIFSCKSAQSGEASYPIVNGIFNIENLGASEVIDLKGDWVFVPNQFVPPDEDFSQYERFEHIHISWYQYTRPEPVYSYATYAVRIKNFASEGVYAVKTGSVASAFTAYFNGKEIFRSGQVGTSKETEVFNWDSAFMVLPTNGLTEGTLVFHVSNYHDRLPGFLKPVEIAFYSTLISAKNKDVLTFIILAGFLLAVGVFFISLYIFYPKEKSSIFFGMLCANFSLRICCYDEFLITRIIPQINSILLFKLGYATFPLTLIYASFFIHELFGSTKRRILWIILLPAFLYTAINIFAPMQVSANLLIYAQIYIFSVAIYDCIIVIIAAFKRDKSAYLFLLALLFFFLVAVRDILISNRIIEGEFLSQLGVVALLVPMAVIVLRYFKTSSDNLISITKKIELTNAALAKFVPNQFMNFLNKKHIDIRLGDNILKDMYIAFIHLGIYKVLDTEQDRLNVLQIYNKALADINPIIEKHNGFIDKYLAEGLMVLFYGSAEDTIDCMLEIKELVQKENFEREINNMQKIKLASGIHYGKLMIGTIGEAARMDSTVISDAVNIASRLHFYALKKETEIFISKAVKDNINRDDTPHIEFKHSGLIRFRGKEEPISIYEVIKK